MKTRITQTNLLRNLSTLFLGGALLFTCPGDATAAVFAKYDGVDGESQDANHDKWIDVLSIDWGSHKPGGGATGQSRRRGAAVVEDLTLTMEFDRSSPKIQEACLIGKVFPKIEIDVVANRDDTDGESFLTYKLKDVIVTSYLIIVADDGSTALQVSMSFSTLMQTHTDGEGNETTLDIDRPARDVVLTEKSVEPKRER